MVEPLLFSHRCQWAWPYRWGSTQLAEESLRRATIDSLRFGAKEFEKIQQERLAGLGFRGADIEIGGAGKGVEAPGLGDPKGKDGELLIVADEVLAQERDDRGQHVHARSFDLRWLRGLHSGRRRYEGWFFRLLFEAGQHFFKVILRVRIHDFLLG